MTFMDERGVVTFGPPFSFFSVATVLFLLFKLLSTNLLNIYFASACWESFAPKFEGAKGYAIVGLIGTAAYTFIQVYAPILFLEELANCYIASLGVVLLMAFLVRIVVRHRPRSYEQAINGFCWFIGCLAGTVMMIQSAQDGIEPVLFGVASSALVFLCVIFVEETVWAVNKIWADYGS
jgi:purine-cytosine permease-like protein